MAFRQSERSQQMFLPPSIEEYVAQDDPVRAYDLFVDNLDWRALGIVADEHQAGCPAGHRLTYRRTCEDRRWREYQLDGGTCCACEHYKQCTRGRNGRKIVRYFNEDLRDRLRRQFEEPANQEIYKRRKQKVELPFGHFKRNLGADHFLLRGLAGVRVEMSLLASCFNVSRLIGLFGVAGLIARLSAL